MLVEHCYEVIHGPAAYARQLRNLGREESGLVKEIDEDAPCLYDFLAPRIGQYGPQIHLCRCRNGTGYPRVNLAFSHDMMFYKLTWGEHCALPSNLLHDALLSVCGDFRPFRAAAPAVTYARLDDRVVYAYPYVWRETFGECSPTCVNAKTPS